MNCRVRIVRRLPIAYERLLTITGVSPTFKLFKTVPPPSPPWKKTPPGCASGLRKLNVNWLSPTVNSFTILGVGIHRQLNAKFRGSRSVFTLHSPPGKNALPEFAASQTVF